MPDGTFRLGPLPKGTYQITAIVDPPRATATATGATNDENLLLELKPDGR